jgi:hypothetical protein
MTVSVRSSLAAGLAAATLGAVVLVPVSTPRTDALTLSKDAFTWSSIELSSIEVSAAVAPLLAPFTSATAAVNPGPVAAATGSAGEAIINTFNAVEPFVQYGFELAAWATGYLPWPIGWLGQQIDIAYNTGEPIVQALVYSFAYLIDGQFDLIGLTLSYGLNLAVTNFVEGEIAWVLSFLPPLPPLPPPPPFPTAAVASRVVAAAVAGPADSARVGTDTPVTEAPVDAVPTETPAIMEPVAETSAVTGPDAETSADTGPEAETPAPRATRAVARRAVAARQSLPAPAAVDTDPAALVATAVDAADATSAVSAPIAAPVKEPRRAARSTAARSADTDA